MDYWKLIHQYITNEKYMELEDFTNSKLKKQNRIKKTLPLSDKHFWCHKCDHDLVSENQQCLHCGHKNKLSKHQKV